jgi:hypothetical protein
MSLPSGISLTLEEGRADGDTIGRYRDERCGLELLIPGGPVLRAPVPSPNEPPCEAEITLSRLPITMALRLSILPADAAQSVRPIDLVRAIAQTRSTALPRPHAATPEQLKRWGCEAAASEIYPLPVTQGGDGAADTEEVLVLLRAGQLVTIFLRFPRARLQGPSWALWSSVVLGRLRFLDAASPGSDPPLFPPSTFLAPGIDGLLHADCAQRIDRLQPLAQLAAAGSTRTVNELHKHCALLLSATDPPDRAIGPAERRDLLELLIADLPEDAAASALAHTLAEVQSGFDLRGFALLVLHVLGVRTASFSAPA